MFFKYRFKIRIRATKSKPAEHLRKAQKVLEMLNAVNIETGNSCKAKPNGKDLN